MSEVHSARVNGLARRVVVVSALLQAACWTTTVADPVPDPEPSPPVCGDLELDRDTEECDDGNLEDGDGCTAACTVEENYNCFVGISDVTTCYECGNGFREPGETCDDGNAVAGDGCDETCVRTEIGFVCERSDTVPTGPENPATVCFRIPKPDAGIADSGPPDGGDVDGGKTDAGRLDASTDASGP